MATTTKTTAASIIVGEVECPLMTDGDAHFASCDTAPKKESTQSTTATSTAASKTMAPPIADAQKITKPTPNAPAAASSCPQIPAREDHPKSPS